jgi:tRNA threonylcarbamoyladenosine modification (KEOPS) complex  Pcc1 subunit
MKQNKPFHIKSKIELVFSNPELSNFAYNSFLPELRSKRSNRSVINVKLSNESLFFYIKSRDITAYRASINEIINLGKIVEDTIEIHDSI